MKRTKAAAVSGCQQWGTRAYPLVLRFLPAFLFHSGVFLLTVKLILRPLFFILAMMAGIRLKDQSPLHSITCSGKGLEPAEDSLLKLFDHSSCQCYGSAPVGNDSTGTSAARNVFDLFQDVSHLKGVRKAPEKTLLPLSLSNASGLFLLRCENWDTHVGQLGVNHLMEAVPLGKHASDLGRGCSQHGRAVNRLSAKFWTVSMLLLASVFGHGATVLLSVTSCCLRWLGHTYQADVNQQRPLGGKLQWK